MTRVVLNRQELARLTQDRAGPAGRYMVRVGQAVQNGAKRRVRVDTGALRASIQWEVAIMGGHLTARIGTNSPYGWYIEDLDSYLKAALADIP